MFILKIPWVFQVFPEYPWKHLFFQVFQDFQGLSEPWTTASNTTTTAIFLRCALSTPPSLYRQFKNDDNAKENGCENDNNYKNDDHNNDKDYKKRQLKLREKNNTTTTTECKKNDNDCKNNKMQALYKLSRY